DLVNADLLLMLSDIDGFYESDPTHNQSAQMFDWIQEITPEIEQLAGGKGSEFGTGGMLTKLIAADYCLKRKRKMVLTNGKHPEILFDILEGQKVGTLFMKKPENG